MDEWMHKTWVCFLPHTSDLMEKVLYARLSGAVHLMGNLAPAWAVYVSPVISLLNPKSATFTTWFSPTKQFLAARSLREKDRVKSSGVIRRQMTDRRNLTTPVYMKISFYLCIKFFFSRYSMAEEICVAMYSSTTAFTSSLSQSLK